MKKKIITLEDIRAIIKDGKDYLEIDKEDVITSIALDLIDKENIKIGYRNNNNNDSFKNNYDTQIGMKYIDFRSDTVTKPTREMLDAMYNAEVDDDVYEDDPTVKELQEKSSIILNKEAALFVPSGTFGNQLALMTHTKKGDEVIINYDNHIVLHEVAANVLIAAVQLRTIDEEMGIVNMKKLKSVFHDGKDIHSPRTGLICAENAHGSGKVIPLDNLRDVYQFSESKGIPVHLDGARIFNAATFLNIEPKEIAKYCDSVMFCLSKGLCAPIGSILAGEKKFIEKARKNRKLMGGGMRQVGYLAAAGLISLDKMVPRLKEDHINARYLAKKLEDSEIFKIKKDRLDINMIFYEVNYEFFNEDDFISFLFKNNIKINPRHNNEFRFVTHYWINKEKIDYFVEAVNSYKSKY